MATKGEIKAEKAAEKGVHIRLDRNSENFLQEFDQLVAQVREQICCTERPFACEYTKERGATVFNAILGPEPEKE